MKPIILIPARMAATRLPGKPLRLINGTPMILHVIRRAQEANIGPVIVAAGDPEIADVVEKSGAMAVLTSPSLPSGTDRIFDVLKEVDAAHHHDVVVNLQGDLPTVEPQVIKGAINALKELDADIGTAAAEITNDPEKVDPNVVKAVVSWQRPDVGRALYFTRVTAPSGQGPLFHHVGIYAYTRRAIERFTSLPPSPLEQRERLEQLRALEAGMFVAVAKVNTVPLGVDTEADLAKAEEILKNSKR